MNAVAGAVNALFGTGLGRQDVLNLAGWDIDDVVAANIGNGDILEAIERICEMKNLQIRTEVFIKSNPLLASSSKRLWNEFNRNAADEHTVLIYHAENHYTLIAGYFEDPKAHYVVLAEHCTEWDPIRVISADQLRRQISRYHGYGILRVKKL